MKLILLIEFIIKLCWISPFTPVKRVVVVVHIFITAATFMIIMCMNMCIFTLNTRPMSIGVGDHVLITHENI